MTEAHAAAEEHGGPAPEERTQARSGPARGTLAGRLRTAALQRLFATRLYGLLLRPRGRAELTARAADPWGGNADRANAIFQGRYRFAHSEVQVFNQPPWTVAPPSTEWQAEASSFSWLRDFRDDGGEAAQKGARELVRTWIDAHARWSPVAWRPDVTGHRLLAWCSHADFLLGGADTVFRSRFLASLARQTRHLERAWPTAPAGAGMLAALAGLMVAETCFGRGSRAARTLPRRLETELRGQVLGDGCHVTRNPSAHAAVLRDLIWLMASLNAAGAAVPLSVQGAIDHMAPMLGFFRHGDGALALFHGGVEEDPALLAETLAAVALRVRLRSAATYAGYERLSAGNAVVLMDAGPPAALPFDGLAHAGTLALEFSVGRERMVVNCGHRRGERWRQASRATAAHSTVVVGDTNSSDVRPGGLNQRPHRVTVRRQEDDGNLWFDAEHDGYFERFGLFHRRRVYLAAEGTTFRGEDIVEGPGEGEAAPTFAVRFHLHPDVQVSLAGGDGALLRLPGGTGWRFRSVGAQLALDESVYLGRASEVRRAEQLVLTGRVTAGGSTVKWAFAKIETA